MCVRAKVYYVLTCSFHVFLGGNVISHGRWGEFDGLKRINVCMLVLVLLEAESSRCVAARGGLFGMQRGAWQTFDAILREVLISALETWTRGSHMNAWTWPEDYYDIMTL